MKNNSFLYVLLMAQTLLFSACATREPADYTAFAQARPRSILVLPPINHSTEIQAGNSLLSWSSSRKRPMPSPWSGCGKYLARMR